jgi:DNA-binding MarR family transcriptional regulator
VTPLQAGVLLFLRRHANAKLTDAATALRLRLPTLSEVVNDLVRKRWVTKRRSVTDTRVVHLSLSLLGQVLAQKIEEQVRQVSTGVAANKILTAAGLKQLLKSHGIGDSAMVANLLIAHAAIYHARHGAQGR